MSEPVGGTIIVVNYNNRVSDIPDSVVGQCRRGSAALASWLLAFRFVAGQRPAWVERLPRIVANIGGSRGDLRPPTTNP